MNRKLFLSFCTLLTLSFIFFSCIEDEPKTEPIVSLAAPSNITSNTATVSGSVTADGGASIIEKGVCWSTTNKTPTTSDSKYSGGPGTGSFSSSITGLTPGTTYNLRAFATNSVGTAYSSAFSFTTLALLPTLTTNDATLITANSFSSGGNITSDGGSPVTARGVCWGTTTAPTIANSKTSDGIGTGTFTSAISGLTAGTTYYVRSYATNSIGTSYGAQVTVTTTPADGQYKAYIFIEPQSKLSLIVNYLKTVPNHSVPTTLNTPFYGFFTGVGIKDTNYTDLLNYIDMPYWYNGILPSVIQAEIPQSSGGFDAYGVYKNAYNFSTFKIAKGTLDEYGWVTVFIPTSGMSNDSKRQTKIVKNNQTAFNTNATLYSYILDYTGTRIPKGQYRVYSSYSGTEMRIKFNTTEDWFIRGGN